MAVCKETSELAPKPGTRMPLSALFVFVGVGWRCDFVVCLGVVWSYGRHGSGDAWTRVCSGSYKRDMLVTRGL
ncbi:hypothetical protein D5086_015460 [Populus alba]|uniref:Uncharacterized protein n=1 Tax=Populus alba TaxID=43335 RepID=A0ACC4BR77_POPAL